MTEANSGMLIVRLIKYDEREGSLIVKGFLFESAKAVKSTKIEESPRGYFIKIEAGAVRSGQSGSFDLTIPNYKNGMPVYIGADEKEIWPQK